MLFRSQDLSQIKEFCRQEWTKILQGRVSIQDFVVAKEVRLGSSSSVQVVSLGILVTEVCIAIKVYHLLALRWRTVGS